MRFASRLWIVCAVLLPDLSLALEPLDCEMEASGEGGYSGLAAPADLGQGFVGHVATLAIPGTFSTEVVMTDCASGQTIHAVTRSETEGQTVVAAVDPVAVLQAAIAAPETIGLDDVVAVLLDAGVVAVLRPRDTQTCGCAVFYPELRGDKPAWSMQ